MLHRFARCSVLCVTFVSLIYYGISVKFRCLYPTMLVVVSFCVPVIFHFIRFEAIVLKTKKKNKKLMQWVMPLMYAVRCTLYAVLRNVFNNNNSIVQQHGGKMYPSIWQKRRIYEKWNLNSQCKFGLVLYFHLSTIFIVYYVHYRLSHHLFIVNSFMKFMI